MFDGETYEEAIDGRRLARQLSAVRDLMADGQWRTLREIAGALGAPEASVSARLRDMRKERHGAWTVERMRATGTSGLYLYRALKPAQE